MPLLNNSKSWQKGHSIYVRCYAYFNSQIVSKFTNLPDYILSKTFIYLILKTQQCQ